jgi:predicted amidophosphoribosyltransferase
MDILVYDDVFTDGHTLYEVARCLKLQGGAADVCGVTLARQIYQGQWYL